MRNSYPKEIEKVVAAARGTRHRQAETAVLWVSLENRTAPLKIMSLVLTLIANTQAAPE